MFRSAPFQRILEPGSPDGDGETKFKPLAVAANPVPRAGAEVGLSPKSRGTGFRVVTTPEFEMSVPVCSGSVKDSKDAGFVTVTAKVNPVAISEPRMIARSCVALSKKRPFILTVELNHRCGNETGAVDRQGESHHLRRLTSGRVDVE